jgi:hypothetical protein
MGEGPFNMEGVIPYDTDTSQRHLSTGVTVL